jgi:hypothetical protein
MQHPIFVYMRDCKDSCNSLRPVRKALPCRPGGQFASQCESALSLQGEDDYWLGSLDGQGVGPGIDELFEEERIMLLSGAQL